MNPLKRLRRALSASVSRRAKTRRRLEIECLEERLVLSGNLIVNGSFEDPIVYLGGVDEYNGGQAIGSAGWTAVGAVGANVDLIQTTYAEPDHGITAFNAQQGLNSMDLTGAYNSGPTSGVTQAVSTTVGQTYDLSFYVGRAGGISPYLAGPATVDLSINGGTSVSYTNSNETDGSVNWEQFTTSFVAVGPATTITFLNGTPQESTFAGLDNVVLTGPPVPEGFDTVQSGTLANNASTTFTFSNAPAGLSIYLNSLGFSVSMDANFTDPNGQPVFDDDPSTGNAGPYVLTVPGTYTLTLTNNSGSSGTYDFNMNMLDMKDSSSRSAV